MPAPIPTTTHMMPAGYQMPYGPPAGQRGILPTFPTGDYMLPRPGQQAFHHHHHTLNSNLQAQNVQYQTPYHMGPLPGQSHQQGTLPSPMTAIPPPTPVQKPKPAKTKPKVAKASKVTKPRVARASKVKQRPQNSKHLTPSLRAAIITLKVTDPGRSFKEIGEILSLPAGDDDEEDEDDDQILKAHKDTAESIAVTGEPTTASLANDTVSSTADITTQTTTESILDATSNTKIAEPTSPKEGRSLQPKPKTKSSKTKAKDRRKPIPRNTVAGIFKRAVDRAGTDSDLYKLLEQTGRRAGSGRPKKGTGKKDRARAAAVAAGDSAGIDGAEMRAIRANGAGMSLDEQSQGQGIWRRDLGGNMGLDGNGVGNPASLGMGLEGDDDDVEDGDLGDMDEIDMGELDMDDGDVPGAWGSDDDGGAGDGTGVDGVDDGNT